MIKTDTVLKFQDLDGIKGSIVCNGWERMPDHDAEERRVYFFADGGHKYLLRVDRRDHEGRLVTL